MEFRCPINYCIVQKKKGVDKELSQMLTKIHNNDVIFKYKKPDTVYYIFYMYYNGHTTLLIRAFI